MNAIETGIDGLKVIEPRVFGDERGWFMEAHSRSKLDALDVESDVIQINHSFSARGVLRGLHFQIPPHGQTKLVRCLRGRLYDVAVDVRVGSPTFGRWFGVELSDENRKMLYVPDGFAHGFYAVEDCELMYLCGRSGYQPEAEGGLRFDDPALSIGWPLEGEPTVNDRDAKFPRLNEFESPFVWEGQKQKAKEIA